MQSKNWFWLRIFLNPNAKSPDWESHDVVSSFAMRELPNGIANLVVLQYAGERWEEQAQEDICGVCQFHISKNYGILMWSLSFLYTTIT